MMAQDIVSGLFGLSPNDVYQQQNLLLDKRANTYAEQNPFQRAAGSMFRAGGMMGDMGAQAMGYELPQIQEAKMTEAALSGLDINDPKAIYERAQQINEPRLKMKLMFLAQNRASEIQKLQLESQKGALAERKQNFMEDEAFALKKMEAEARIRQNDERIADARTNAQQRMELMRENNQIKMLIASMRQQGQATEKPMTPAQQMKLDKDMAVAGSALRTVKDTFFDVQNKGEALKNHPGLAGASGVRGAFPSMPSGQSAKAEALLKEFQSSVQKIGLEIIRAGGSIGQMTEKEWKIVEGMVANIDPVKLGKEGTIEQINKAISIAEGMMNNAVTTYNERFGEYEQKKSAAPKSQNKSNKVVDFGSL